MEHSLVHLSSPDVSIIFEISDSTVGIRYWGSAIPQVETHNDLLAAVSNSIANSNFDIPLYPGVLREHSRGFLGHPAISGHRLGKSWSTHFSLTSIQQSASSLALTLIDSHVGLTLELTYVLNEFGILSINAALTNTGESSYNLEEFNYWLPLPDRASEVMDFTGRWSHERHPQRRAISYGVSTREIREGRSGHDYTIAQLALAGQPDFRSGEVWALSMAWSGNSQHFVEKLPSGEISIGAGELLEPGEAMIEAGARYVIPGVIANYSNEGFDGLSHNYYRWLRSRPHHPTNIRPRPVTLNVWEAVYFDHDEAKIKAIVDKAAEVGVERIVLDDGWFNLRRHDRAGLGDWVVDPAVWPQGLAPVIAYINEKGLEFGLWFEGEMVNPDSDLYRAHPEWILHEGDRTPPPWRHQQVLDLTHPGAFEHVFSQVDAVLSEYNIAYIKWDHNRVLVDAGHLGQAAVHNQTAAIYRLFDQLKERHPGLEIESCASGAARIDLGVIDHVDRFWTSDNNDALERQTIQRWTGLVIPPEMLGTHIGPTHSHQTGRTQEISFRAVNAFFGHAGIEWNITEASDEELRTLKHWIALYKKNRALLHSGKAIRVDHPDNAAFLYGVVAHDRSEAIFAYVQHRMNTSTFPAMATFPGLDPLRNYRVKVLHEAGAPKKMQVSDPLWVSNPDGIVQSGALLAQLGVRPPILSPENGILISIAAI
jgi:alpha-galactosidase